MSSKLVTFKEGLVEHQTLIVTVLAATLGVILVVVLIILIVIVVEADNFETALGDAITNESQCRYVPHI